MSKVMLEGRNVLVIGAGDLATGVIRRLHLAGARVVATELERPLTVRTTVSFSEAVHQGEHTVEGVTARRAETGQIDGILELGMVPVLVDPETAVLGERPFDVVVDARLAKKNLGVGPDDAGVVIGLGPGFTAGLDCHAVVETLQGGGPGPFDPSRCRHRGLCASSRVYVRDLSAASGQVRARQVRIRAWL